MSYALKIENNLEAFGNIIKPLKTEYKRAYDAVRDGTPFEPMLTDEEIRDQQDKAVCFTSTEYGEFVNARCEPNILSEEALANRISFFKRLFLQQQLADYVSQGSTMWLMLFPLDGYGNKTAKPAGVSECYVGPKGLTSGFTATPAYYYHLYPSDLRACSFEVPRFSGDYNLPTHEDFNLFIERYSEAYRKLIRALS